MKFIADLHIHSKFSMATASSLDLEHLYISAQEKGISVIATGDCTHPGWYEELSTKLVPAEYGLYALKNEIASDLDSLVPQGCRREVRFMLSSEISCIYKKNGKVRKNHNLVYFPDLASVKKFNTRLGRMGNIVSDGRPILGLDSRDLLEMVLETHTHAFLIPAHIWTPWFSLLGSKSGFNHITDCFGDLTRHIFAVETGLSSDPAMNWRVSFLDDFCLVSNSDAHSPGNLGREANILNTDFDYMGIYNALKYKDPEMFLGTYEFYPEEGKYHLDGHRKCGVRFSPEESMGLGGICPVCGKPLTLGVLYRVCELADRKNPDTSRKIPFHSIVPLKNILSEIHGVGPKTKKVQASYEQVLKKCGSELSVLWEKDKYELKSLGIPLLDEAIVRVRENRIFLEGGYDGDYGKVKIFSSEEKNDLLPQKKFFPLQEEAKGEQKKTEKYTNQKIKGLIKDCSRTRKEEKAVLQLNDEQEAAVHYTHGPSLIIAGPGTGKTRTLTCKIARMAKKADVSKGVVLAITFTRKAAEEMKERLDNLGVDEGNVLVQTFHGLGYEILEESGEQIQLADRNVYEFLIRQTIRKSGLNINVHSAKQRISDVKKMMFTGAVPDNESFFLLTSYEKEMNAAGMMDFDDLVIKSIECLEKKKSFYEKFIKRFTAVCIDEYQDLDAAQYRLVKLMTKDISKITAIGDPNQSIYGFRGGDSFYFDQFRKDWPGTKLFRLTRNYRSSENILSTAWKLMESSSEDSSLKVISGIPGRPVVLKVCSDEKKEAEWIADCIQKGIGGTGHHAIYAGMDDHEGDRFGFSDIAVLVRTRKQMDIIGDVFLKKGIPFQTGSEKSLQENAVVKEIIAAFRILSGQAMVWDLFSFSFGIPCKESWIQKLWEENPLLSFHMEKKEMGSLNKKISALTKMYHSSRDSIQLMEAVLDEVDPEKKKRDDLFVAALLKKAEKKDPAAFLKEIFLEKEIDTVSEKAEKVSMITLHASKGLEFPMVFMPGCEEGFLPHRKGGKSLDEDEERRLFYVGITRAASSLWLSWAKRRRIFGKSEERMISPFVRDILFLLAEEKERKAVKEKKDGQMRLF
ncbi:UvrD-helicase domain-containing protein [Desulfobotulus sp. H1]|uniref:DNA 3'-5' helicase n=1 Tax=Desulfobotulus pelophilus TaxID=2823377 RepID=A0ABT3NBY1_9BACT|nr:UvrD-helicase domain-containing protein [Desulfobotulus pelophilus]MCW7754971.1 UvrD-helicase domain-containing protein [Desulfobotulus pelophilus]